MPADLLLLAGQAPSARTRHYGGPERRAPESRLSNWLTRMLDEIDYGMLLVSSDGQVLYLNHAARLELDSSHPLQLLGRALKAHRAQDVAPLHDALQAAQRGLRKLVTVGEGVQRISMSVVPLTADANATRNANDPLGAATLLVLGKRRVCQQLTVQGFARSVNLTPAETRVLEQLCVGTDPTQIALELGVAVCTVRTQIGAIRSKTGASSIRDLVRQVAVLPPLVGALRGSLAAAL